MRKNDKNEGYQFSTWHDDSKMELKDNIRTIINNSFIFILLFMILLSIRLTFPAQLIIEQINMMSDGREKHVAIST